MDDEEVIEGRSGRLFVLGVLVVSAVFVAFLLFVSPGLQSRLGIGDDAVGFTAPDAPVTVPLRGGEDWAASVTHDASGVYAEVVADGGAVFRSDAAPQAIRAIWGIAGTRYPRTLLVVATPPDAATVTAVTTAGEEVTVDTEARNLPAAFAVLELPTSAVVDRVIVRADSGSELTEATCGEGNDDTQPFLGGGCVVPRED